MGFDLGGELGGRAHEADDFVVVGDERGQQPGANVASDAEQENLHFDILGVYYRLMIYCVSGY